MASCPGHSALCQSSSCRAESGQTGLRQLPLQPPSFPHPGQIRWTLITLAAETARKRKPPGLFTSAALGAAQELTVYTELWRTFYCLKIIIEASKTYNPTCPNSRPSPHPNPRSCLPLLLPTPPLGRTLLPGGCRRSPAHSVLSPATERHGSKRGMVGSQHP